MTKRQQALIDRIYLAETHSEQVQAFIDALEEIPEDRRELVLQLMRAEYYIDHSAPKLS